MSDLKKLKNDTIKGVFWSSASHFYTLGIQFVITLILSRILIPDDFATIGLLNVFTIICNILIDSGFAQSLIRESELKSLDYSSVFYFNVFVAIIIYLVLFYLSPLIEVFFHIHGLKFISRIVFVQLIFNSLSIIPRVVLTREMKYNVLSIVGVISITVSAISGITAAIMGLGVYALVIQMLVSSFLHMLLIWAVSKWRLTFEFSFVVIKRLFGFSMYLLITSLVITLFNNLYTLIIGRRYTQTELGYYTQAKKMEEIPSMAITNIIVNVSYTAMSKVKDDIVLLRKAYKKILGVNLYVVAPIMMFCLVSAENLIPFLFGDQWLNSIPYFKILCVYGMLFPLFSVNGNILKVLGLGRKYTFQEVIRRVLMLLFLIPTIKIDIDAMLWGWVVSMIISIVISFMICGKPIGYSLVKQIVDLFPIILVTAISMLLPYVFSKYFMLPKFIMLSIQGILYLCSYVILSKIVKIQAYTDVVLLIKDYPLFRKIFKN